MVAPWCPKPSKKHTGFSNTLMPSLASLCGAYSATFCLSLMSIAITTSRSDSKDGMYRGRTWLMSQKSRRWRFTMLLSTSCTFGITTGSPSSRWTFVLMSPTCVTTPLILPSRLWISSASTKARFRKIRPPEMKFCTMFLAAKEKAKPPMPRGATIARIVRIGRPTMSTQAKTALIQMRRTMKTSMSRRTMKSLDRASFCRFSRGAFSRCMARRYAAGGDEADSGTGVWGGCFRCVRSSAS
mmetsp:Transcript_8647/g.24017  ORF Transcript_8647/g.24017 Transcript_8647/m.24017 type:complete len:241 (+) Transcript_8647:550-1272(+)